ncbi:MAG: hypothetical protein F6J89_14230 [Symploca sp. SIO1C4]|uniref:Uncharacterized protein n=1 Tax=Symploca sp. SIO1C4 TaxID=2607765 RepID=A0A6B3NB51_9CYAN|nr:hypothetical protein [Symploca sp. SIO1C4]
MLNNPFFNLSELNGNNGFVINGVDAGDNSGFSVSAAGDINNDGINDLIIGAPFAKPNGEVAVGASYVVFGGTGVGTGGTFELSELDGSNGFAINGTNANDFSGLSVSAAGDINNDGIDDLIIGTPGAGNNDQAFAGASYVVFGGTSVGAGGSLELSELDGSNGFIINGVNAYDFSGSSVSAVGDINGDEFDDLIIGAKGFDPNGQVFAGASYVVFGGNGIDTSGTFELSDLDGSNGFVIHGMDAYDYSGLSVKAAGDINNDGIDDLIIGAPGADPDDKSFAGESYVIFGSIEMDGIGSLELSELDGSNGFTITGIDAYDQIGFSIGAAGDINNDGIDDLIIGASIANSNGNFYAGESYVVFGSANVGITGNFDLSALDGNNGFVIQGIDTEDLLGSSVSAAGDINNDGIDDLIIGAEGADPDGNNIAGEVYLVFGGAGVGTGGSLELSAPDGSNSFIVFNGINAGDLLGSSVSAVGDVNSDGIDDLILGAPAADPHGKTVAGASYIFFGSTFL